eukprot:4611320-Alexandrium_andersonii.AAC.1
MFESHPRMPRASRQRQAQRGRRSSGRHSDEQDSGIGAMRLGGARIRAITHARRRKASKSGGPRGAATKGP